MSQRVGLVSSSTCGYNHRVSPAHPDPRLPRSASSDAEGDSGPPASSREVVAGHQPPAPRGTQDTGPSVVVNEPGQARYELYADATVVTRRRTQSLPDGPIPAPRKRWATYLVWGVVGAAAFLLGGALSKMNKSGGTGTVVEAATVGGTATVADSPVEPSKPAQAVVAEPTDTEPEEQAIDPTALDKLPEVKPKLASPRAPSPQPHSGGPAKPAAPPKATSAAKPTAAPAPVKDIPAEI